MSMTLDPRLTPIWFLEPSQMGKRWARAQTVKHCLWDNVSSSVGELVVLWVKHICKEDLVLQIKNQIWSFKNKHFTGHQIQLKRVEKMIKWTNELAN